MSEVVGWVPMGAQASSSYHHGNLRRALLDAVEAIVGEQGLEALTLRACARRAEVSPAAVSHHFGDKRGMLTEFAVEGLDALKAQVACELREAGADAGERVRGIGRAYVRTALERPAHFRVMFRRELLHEDERLQNGSVFELLMSEIAGLDRFLGREPHDLRPRAQFAWATVHGHALLLLDATANPNVDTDGDVERAMERLDAVLTCVLDGLTGPG